MVKVLYTAHAHITGGREGHARKRHRKSRAAEMLGQPKGAEAGALEPGNLVKWVLVVEVLVFRSACDLGQQVSPLGRTWKGTSRVIHGGHGNWFTDSETKSHSCGSPGV